MIWGILSLGLILRLISLNQSLWLDEAINVMAAKSYSFLGILTEYAKADFHPPLYFAIIWIWTKLFGFSEIIVRLPSVIFGLLTIWLVYLTGRKVYSKKLGILAAFLLALNPLHIYYSQEARMYSLATLAVGLNFLLFIKLIKNEKVNFIFIIFSDLLILMSDYVAYLVFPAQLLFILLLKKNYLLKKWSISLLIALIVSSFWIPVFLNQINIGYRVSSDIPLWKITVGSFDVKNIVLTYIKFIIGRISYPDKLIYAGMLMPICLLSGYFLLRGIGFISVFNRKLLLTWLIIPTLLASLISLLVPIYSYFRLLFLLPAFLILISFGILSLKKYQNIFLMVFIFIEIFATLTYLVNPVFQREDWRGLVTFLKSKQNMNILFESSGSFLPFDYYANNQITGIGALKNFPAGNLGDIKDLEFELNKKDVYLVDYLVGISDPSRLVKKSLLSLGYQQVSVYNFNGVGFVYYFKKGEYAQ